MNMYSNLDPEMRTQQVTQLNKRWGQLYELEKEAGERAFKYLLLTNSGGAIATLGFLGASDAALGLPSVKVALFLFIVGLIFVGISNAKQFHHMSRLFKAWKDDADQYFSDKISWDELNRGGISVRHQISI